MTDSDVQISPTTRVLQEIFPNTLPSELFKFVFDHFNVVTLTNLSATCRILRLQVHNFFTDRLSDQAKKYPEIRESLSRLGWTKNHNHWACDCDCFKLVAGPGFTWGQLNERKSFSTVCRILSSAKNCTTVAGKTFLVTSDGEVVFFENSTDNAMRPSSARSLVSFKSSQIVIWPLASYDQVLAFSLKKPKPNARHALCIYNPSTLSKITEIDLIAHGSKIHEDFRDVRVSFIAFAKETLAIHLEGDSGNILIWKINTKEPEEEGIALLQTIAAPSPYMNSIGPFETFHLNDRFIVIPNDTRVKVLSRSDGALVCQIGRDAARLDAWSLEKEQGDHIAYAFGSFNFQMGHPKLVFQIFSVTQGRMIIQKAFVEGPLPAIRYMKWFGPHLVVILQRDNVLSMMSWQPGFTSFLPCPSNVPVVQRSSRDSGGGASNWAADCVHVDYGGITLALKNGMWNSRNHMWRYE